MRAHDAEHTQSGGPRAAELTPHAGGGGLRERLRVMPLAEQTRALAPRPEAGEGARPEGAGAGAVTGQTIERWVQSALNLLVDAGLTIDGAIGGPTRAAVRAFQRKAPALVGARLAVDGIAGPRTIDAIEAATGASAPAMTERERKRAEVGAGGATSGGEARGGTVAGGGTEVGAPAAALDKDDPGAEATVAGDVKRAIGEAAGKAPADDAKVDTSRAYEEARAWTMARLPAQDTDRARAVYGKLERAWTEASEAHAAWVADGRPAPARGRKAPKDPGPKAAYIEGQWFRQYWMRWCYQFAQKVSSFLDGAKSAGLARLVAQAKDGAATGAAAGVKGRTTLYRGMTMAEVGAAEAAQPKLAPGASIHVKLHFEGDDPYEHADDFHHWMVYAGGGKFSDTLTGKDKSGAAMDASLVAWVKSAFKHPDYAFMHGDARFVAETRRGVPVPRPGLQPRVSAEYDPRQTVTKKKEA